LTSYGNTPAKNYQNWLMQVEVIASQSSVVFLRHSVVTNTGMHAYRCVHGNYRGNILITSRLYCVEWTQYSIRPKWSAICNRSFPGPTRVLNANGISIDLLNCFPCLYRRMEQGSCRRETSLHQRCGIARLTIFLLNVSAVNAKLT